MKKITVTIFLFLSSLSFAQLSGDYYIPQGTNPQGFASLADAVTDVNTNGVSGTVRLLIDDNLSETGANLLLTRNDLSATNNLIIKPAPSKTPTITISGCTSTAGANQYSGFSLSGVSYVTFDGSNTDGGTTKDLTFKMNDATNGRIVIQLYGNCDNVTIKNLNITYQTPMSSSSATRGIYLNGQSTGACDNFIVDNCDIGDASSTPYYATSITGYGTGSIYCTNITIKNSNLYGRIRPVYFYYVGTSSTSCEISGNNIYTYGGTNGTTTYWIFMNYWAGTVNIFNNTLPTLTTNNTVTSGIFGISALAAQTGATSNIYNNIIGGNVAATGTGVPTVIALMYLQDNGTYNVYYNSFYFPSSSQNTKRAVVYISGASAAVTLQNNILINETDATNAYCIYKSSGTLTSNYNDLYVSGSNANVGYWTADRKTLSDWQTNTSQDANSKSKAVNFVDAANGNLKLTGASIGDNDLAGKYLTSVTTDIDGDTRDNYYPYMGADEVSTKLSYIPIDGDLSDASYSTLATKENSNSGFGANIDVSKIVYAFDEPREILYLGVVGKLDVTTSNGIGLWLNFSEATGIASGTSLGQNGDGHYMSGNSGSNVNFKADFEVDYMFALNPGSGSNCYIDGVKLVGSRSNGYLGNPGINGTSATGPSTNNIFTANSTTFAFNNGGGANQGFEIRIPYSELGITTAGTLSAFAFVTSSTAYFSDVTVPGNITNGNPGFDADFSTLSGGPYHSTSSALPVQLTTFTASTSSNGVVLNWSTATEVNNYGFEIERAIDNAQWENIGFVQGHGNSNAPNDYTFTDVDVTSGNYQYRLKQIDFDGTFSYSDVVEVAVKQSIEKLALDVYPNPFNPSTTMAFVLPKASRVSLTIFDITGQKVAELIDNEVMEAGYHKHVFNAGNLASGIYISVLQAEGMQVVKKLQLLK